jgi:hypothetical protein
MGGDRADAGLVVALLGPVEIGPVGGAMTPLSQPRLRVLLGLLGVAAGRVVSAEALVDGVWGEEWSPGQEAGDPMRLAIAWHTIGLVHSRLGEQGQAISCYQQALALVGDWTTPVTRRLLATVLTDLGDACQAAADPLGAARAWQQALQILDDLRLPDSLGVHAKLAERGRRI